MTWLPLLITAGVLIVPKRRARAAQPSGASGDSVRSPASDASGQYNRNARVVSTRRNCERCILMR